METQKFEEKKNSENFFHLSTCSRQISFTRLVSYYPMVPGEKVSALVFCKQFLSYAVRIHWCYHSIHKHSSRSRLLACTYMMTWEMHRCPFEGQHLVFYFFYFLINVLFNVNFKNAIWFYMSHIVVFES